MNLASSEYSEKRDFIRMRIDTPVDVTVPHDNTSISGICRDLSGKGMLVEVDKVIPVGTILDIELASDHGHSPAIKAKAKVARIVSDHTGSCTLGLEILEMDK